VRAALDVARLLASQRVRELIVADDEDPRRAARAGRVPPTAAPASTTGSGARR
jgi:hypothetical protein